MLLTWLHLINFPILVFYKKYMHHNPLKQTIPKPIFLKIFWRQDIFKISSYARPIIKMQLENIILV
jgi:hypothetical protein